jgi:UDP-2,3-diacylglucosamine pyrophosphatase LpxH
VVTTEGTRHLRTLFISDVHLGTRGCQAERLLDFLTHHDADTIYLVGDIVDGWRLRSGWYWPQTHNDVIQKLLRKARKGAQLVYIPGNHDEFLRDYCGTHFGGIVVTRHATHVAADGRRYVVTHGDQFDRGIERVRHFAGIGDLGQALLRGANRTIDAIRGRLDLAGWSFSQWAKYKVKDALNYVRAFEAAVVAEATRQRIDGIICGHVHHASIREFPAARYINCGDWVESCSAAVEHFDGRLELISWKVDVCRDVTETRAMEAQAV